MHNQTTLSVESRWTLAFSVAPSFPADKIRRQSEAAVRDEFKNPQRRDSSHWVLRFSRGI
jgi:hypothetical protein